jgi:hypothetical protein
MTLILRKPSLTKETRSIDFRRAATLGQIPDSHRFVGACCFFWANDLGSATEESDAQTHVRGFYSPSHFFRL